MENFTQLKASVSFVGSNNKIITERTQDYITPESFFRIGQRITLLENQYVIKDARFRIFRAAGQIWIEFMCELS